MKMRFTASFSMSDNIEDCEQSIVFSTAYRSCGLWLQQLIFYFTNKKMLERIVVLFMSDPQTALARQAPSLDLAGPLVPVSFNCHACFFFLLRFSGTFCDEQGTHSRILASPSTHPLALSPQLSSWGHRFGFDQSSLLIKWGGAAVASIPLSTHPFIHHRTGLIPRLMYYGIPRQIKPISWLFSPRNFSCHHCNNSSLTNGYCSQLQLQLQLRTQPRPFYEVRATSVKLTRTSFQTEKEFHDSMPLPRTDYCSG